LPGQEAGATALIQVNCLDTTSPCYNNQDSQYAVIDLEDNAHNGTSLQMLYNPQYNQLSVATGGGASGRPGIIVAGFNTSLGNCSSTASPAVCGNAVIGQVQVAAAATTLTINTTQASNSMRPSFSYSTVGITAPTNQASLLPPYVSAISPGVSFTITLPVAPATNPARINFTFTDGN
jgi:hypothetical protein